MLHLLLWQKGLVRRNELLRGTWRRRISWLAGLAAGGAFIVFIFLTSLAVFSWLLMAQPEAVPGLVAGGFAVLSTLALFWGMGTALADLYLSSDLELLLAAPVPRGDIFGLKLLGEMWQTGASALIPITILVAYGVVVRAGWSYYLAAALVWLIVLATLVAASMVIVMLLMRAMPARRAREIYSFLYVIFFAALWLGWMFLSRGGRAADELVQLQPALTSTSERLAVPPASWAGNLMLAWAQGAWPQVALNGLWLALLAAAVVGFAYWLFERSFHQDWAAMHEVAARARQPRANGRPHVALARRLAGWLPWPARELAAKDWTIFPRDLRQLSRLVMPLVVSLFYVYQFGVASPAPRSLPGVGFWMVLLILPVVPLFFALALATPAIGKEGANFELLRVVPIHPGALLGGKVWMAGVPTTALAVGVTLAVTLLLHISPRETVLLVFLAGLVSVLISAIAVALGALTPNFEATDYRRSVGPLASYGTLVGGGLIWLALVATLVSIAARFTAGPVAMGLQRTFIRSRALLAAIDSPWVLLGVLALDLAVVGGLALLWRMATHRVATWQPGD